MQPALGTRLIPHFVILCAATLILSSLQGVAQGSPAVDPTPSEPSETKVDIDRKCQEDEKAREDGLRDDFFDWYDARTRRRGASSRSEDRKLSDAYRRWVQARCAISRSPFPREGNGFFDASLEDKDFSRENLSGFPFVKVKPPRILVDQEGVQHPGNPPKFNSASLLGAEISESDFRNVDFEGALLALADLKNSDFTGARFANAVLTDARFISSKVDNADFERADLSGVTWEVTPGSLPKIYSLARASGLSDLRFENDPTSLIELRNALDKGGFATQASEINFSIKRTFRERQLSNGVFSAILGAGSYLLFELTCAYGADPYRPVLLIFMLIPLFALLFYLIVTLNLAGAVWVSRPKDGVNKRREGRHLRLGRFLPKDRSAAAIRLASTLLWFSFVNSFRAGYREFNIGDWVTRVHRKDFAMQCTGLAKSLAGVQSLIGFYLLALTVLSAIGKPFW